MLKTLFAAGFLAALIGAANAQYDYGSNNRRSLYGGSGGLSGTGSNPNSHQVDGYTTRNGTYVPSYQRTNPNGTTTDNYGTPGNYNPNNGLFGGSRRSGW